MRKHSNFLNGFLKVAAGGHTLTQEQRKTLDEHAAHATKARNLGYGIGIPTALAGLYARRKKHKALGNTLLGLGGYGTLVGWSGENQLWKNMKARQKHHDKTATPAWFYELHKKTLPLKSTKGYSQTKKGLEGLLKRRGISGE